MEHLRGQSKIGDSRTSLKLTKRDSLAGRGNLENCLVWRMHTSLDIIKK